VPEGKVEKIKEALREVGFAPFSASVSGIGVFPSENYIRVVWVGLESHDAITQLQKDVDDSMKAIGFGPERDFTPHLTLCRVRNVKDREAFLKSVKAIEVEKREFMVSSFKLMKSTLTPQGPVYEVEEEFGAR